MYIHLNNHELFALLQISWQRGTGSYVNIMYRFIGQWYHLLRPYDRAMLHQWASRLLEADTKANTWNGTLQRLWLGRFDPHAQYVAIMRGQRKRCFRAMDRMWWNHIFSVPADMPDIEFQRVEDAPSEHYLKAVQLVSTTRKADLAHLQRKLRLHAATAMKLQEELLEHGIIERQGNQYHIMIQWP